MIGCGECHCRFTSNTAFDMHRTGGYGEPMYSANGKGSRGEITGYTKHTRRCLTEERMIANGMQLDNGRWSTGMKFEFTRKDVSLDDGQEEGHDEQS